MATNIKDRKTEKGSQGSQGGNRGGDKARKDDHPKQSSQAAGKDPHRGRD